MAGTRIALTDFALANPVYAGAAVSVFGVTAWQRNSTLVPLYAGPIGQDTLPNPQYLDSEGKWVQAPFVDQAVVLVIGSQTIASHETGVHPASGSWRGNWQSASYYSPGDLVVGVAGVGVAPGSIFICLGQHVATNTFAADLGADLWQVFVDLSTVNALPLAGGTLTGSLALTTGEVRWVDGNNNPVGFIRHTPDNAIRIGIPAAPYGNETLIIGPWRDIGETFTAYGARIDQGTFSTTNPNAYGFYNNAVAASFITGSMDLRAGFLGGFEAGVSAIAGYSSIDRGGFYAAVGDGPPIFSITGATIGPIRINLATPLTSGQIAYLRKQMFLTTNNTPTSGYAWTTWITAVDPSGTWIDTCGWACGGGGDASVGQVPSGALPTGQPQTILVNPATSLFGGNIVVSMVPGGTALTGIGLEIDYVNNRGYDAIHEDPAGLGLSLQSLGAYPGSRAIYISPKWIVGVDLDSPEQAGVRISSRVTTAANPYGIWSQMGKGFPFVHQLAGVTKFYVDYTGKLLTEKLEVNQGVTFSALPSSATGLTAGQAWRDAAAGGVVKIV